MPEPEKAMVKFVGIKKTAFCTHQPSYGREKNHGLRKRLMSITGFKAYKEWNKEKIFCEFITDYGFIVVKVNLVDGGLAPAES